MSTLMRPLTPFSSALGLGHTQHFPQMRSNSTSGAIESILQEGHVETWRKKLLAVYSDHLPSLPSSCIILQMLLKLIMGLIGAVRSPAISEVLDLRLWRARRRILMDLNAINTEREQQSKNWWRPAWPFPRLSVESERCKLPSCIVPQPKENVMGIVFKSNYMIQIQRDPDYFRGIIASLTQLISQR